jgi:hypothetical protein
MDIAVAALIITVTCLVGLISLGAPPPAKPDPKTVKCPKCTTSSSLEDIRCPNCGNNKTIKFEGEPKAASCKSCVAKSPKLGCPKCGCELTELLKKAEI